MSKVQRVLDVLSGVKPDRTPISFWHHFKPEQACGTAAKDAHIAHLEQFDLDFLKVMNDNGYPFDGVIEGPEDLRHVQVLRGDEDEFTRQLDLIADIKRTVRNRVLLATTLFNSWATLRHMIRRSTSLKPPRLDAAEDAPSVRIRELLALDPSAVEACLTNIGASLANFSRRCLSAGADGVFLSVRDDWVESGESGSAIYERLVRPTDLNILEAAGGGRFNLLHVCGKPSDFAAMAAYPVQVINWADRAAGPAIADVIRVTKPAICAGVDNLNTLPDGTPQECEGQVRDALLQAGRRPMMVAPGCTYDPERVPRENLEAICRAVRAAP